MSKQLLIILILLPFITKSQVVSDARLWTAFSISKKFKDLELTLSEEYRRDENFSHTDKVFTELGAEYEIDYLKGLSVFSNYRFSRENDYETINYDISHRIDFGLNYKYKLDKIQFDLKTKMQIESAASDKNNPTYNRSKLTLKYKLNKSINPFVSYEFFYQLNDERVINRTRLSTGLKYDINKKSGIKLFYTFENKFNTNNLQHNHIYGISYGIEL